MKKVAYIIVFITLFSCSSSSKIGNSNNLFEVLTQQNQGGASILFFEILSEEKEIQMLLNDKNLRKKIKISDIKNSNFVIVNLGEKPTGGYSARVDAIKESANVISITINEVSPNGNVTNEISYPYMILKINSKKEIVFN
jgi:PrcB C-terminal